MVGNRNLGHYISQCAPSAWKGVRSYKLLISLEMFAGRFQAKAVRLALYCTSLRVASLVDVQHCAVLWVVKSQLPFLVICLPRVFF